MRKKLEKQGLLLSGSIQIIMNYLMMNYYSTIEDDKKTFKILQGSVRTIKQSKLKSVLKK